MLVDLSASIWVEKAQLPSWPLYSQQVLHQRWIWWSHRWESMQTDPPWLWNPGQMSTEVQNRGISGPTKGLVSSKNLKKKTKMKVGLTIPTGSWNWVEWMPTNMEWMFFSSWSKEAIPLNHMYAQRAVWLYDMVLLVSRSNYKLLTVIVLNCYGCSSCCQSNLWLDIVDRRYCHIKRFRYFPTLKSHKIITTGYRIWFKSSVVEQYFVIC